MSMLRIVKEKYGITSRLNLGIMAEIVQSGITG